MSKGITQSQWLNIVIIVISGLILTFTTGQRLVIKDLIVDQLIPAQTLKKPLVRQPSSDKAIPKERH
jgi:hypothetical protein